MTRLDWAFASSLGGSLVAIGLGLDGLALALFALGAALGLVIVLDGAEPHAEPPLPCRACHGEEYVEDDDGFPRLCLRCHGSGFAPAFEETR